jgi:hypothetical protein
MPEANYKSENNPINDDDDDISDMDDFDDDDDDDDYDDDFDDDDDDDDDYLMRTCPICENLYESKPIGDNLICCYCFDYLRELSSRIKRKYAFIKDFIVENKFVPSFRERYLSIMAYLKRIDDESQEIVKTEGI